MSSKFFEAQRFEGNHFSTTRDSVVEEGALQIVVNGKPFTITMRTPGADVHLVPGILFSEGLVETPVDIVSLREESNKDGMTVWSAELTSVSQADKKIVNRSLASTSSCGMCGKSEWDAPPDCVEIVGTDGRPPTLFQRDLLPACFKAMSTHQNLFGKTGGSHAAAIFSANGELLAFGEDVGRHNAVDKAIGDLWLKNDLGKAILLCVSGRVSYEIAAKARRAGLAILAAVSAPSSMAVEFCRTEDITLLGFCRGERATAYSHPERLIALEEIKV